MHSSHMRTSVQGLTYESQTGHLPSHFSHSRPTAAVSRGEHNLSYPARGAPSLPSGWRLRLECVSREYAAQVCEHSMNRECYYGRAGILLEASEL